MVRLFLTFYFCVHAYACIKEALARIDCPFTRKEQALESIKEALARIDCPFTRKEQALESIDCPFARKEQALESIKEALESIYQVFARIFFSFTHSAKYPAHQRTRQI